MSEDWYSIAIAALLPLTVAMLVTQVNPYHALVIRGIVGAVAALVYALLGAADVALTEALVGTMLSITLYAITVRSSMSLRLGLLAEDADGGLAEPGAIASPLTASVSNRTLAVAQDVLPALRKALRPHHLRLELLPYHSLEALQTALNTKEIHATCVSVAQSTYWERSRSLAPADPAPYHLHVRLQRLYDLLESGLPPTVANLSYVPAGTLQPRVVKTPDLPFSNALEGQL